MEKKLFALLRLGLGMSTTKEENLSDFIMLTSPKWTQVINLARKQGVLGIVLDGINCLEVSDEWLAGVTRGLLQQTKLEIIGESVQIEQRNRQQMMVMEELADKWEQKGYRVMVMKGQANGTLYPKPEHRSPGDIDCYLINANDNLKDNKESYRIGNEVARDAGAKVDESWYKHSVISYKGETFENHQYFVHTRDGMRGKQLEEELEEALRVDKSEYQPLTKSTVIPPVQWTAMFLTYHACAHFVSEGLRLKQLLDWAMFLDKHQNDVDWSQFYAYCERNHLRRFADAATAISVKHLGIKITNPAIVTTSPYADKILHNALFDDDYVFSSGESGWKNRLHIVKNIFRYRWKYEDVYETSPWWQLWYYASGYLFKTE